MSEVIELDFRSDTLLGYESPKSLEVINNLRKKIRLGIIFPLVNVFLLEDGNFSLCPITKIEGLNGLKYIDGGHHRSISYFQELGRMRVNLILRPHLPFHALQQGYIDITKIPVISQPEILDYKQKIFGNYF